MFCGADSSSSFSSLNVSEVDKTVVVVVVEVEVNSLLDISVSDDTFTNKIKTSFQNKKLFEFKMKMYYKNLHYKIQKNRIDYLLQISVTLNIIF